MSRKYKTRRGYQHRPVDDTPEQHVFEVVGQGTIPGDKDLAPFRDVRYITGPVVFALPDGTELHCSLRPDGALAVRQDGGGFPNFLAVIPEYSNVVLLRGGARTEAIRAAKPTLSPTRRPRGGK